MKRVTFLMTSRVSGMQYQPGDRATFADAMALVLRQAGTVRIEGEPPIPQPNGDRGAGPFGRGPILRRARG